MKVLCVIPSRLGSTRLARKPLALIQGQPMIQRVYESAVKCPSLSMVVVATDSPEIAEVVHKSGGKVEMTDASIQTGSDRAAAVAERYPDMDIIINLQGDQPFIQPHMLTELIKPYLDGERPEMTTLACPLEAHEYTDPGVVKVITDKQNNAIYFSRAPIPYYRAEVQAPVRHHLGLYAYTRDFLKTFNALPQTP